MMEEHEIGSDTNPAVYVGLFFFVVTLICAGMDLLLADNAYSVGQWLVLAIVIFIGLEIYLLRKKNFFGLEITSFRDFVFWNILIVTTSAIVSVIMIPLMYVIDSLLKAIFYDINWRLVGSFLLKWGTIIGLVVGLKYYLYYKFIRGEK